MSVIQVIATPSGMLSPSAAAVSTATLLTANAIEHFKLNHLIDLTIDEGYFNIVLKEQNMIIETLLENLDTALHDIEKQYPKYMKNQKEG